MQVAPSSTPASTRLDVAAVCTSGNMIGIGVTTPERFELGGMNYFKDVVPKKIAYFVFMHVHAWGYGNPPVRRDAVNPEACPATRAALARMCTGGCEERFAEVHLAALGEQTGKPIVEAVGIWKTSEVIPLDRLQWIDTNVSIVFSRDGYDAINVARREIPGHRAHDDRVVETILVTKFECLYCKREKGGATVFIVFQSVRTIERHINVIEHPETGFVVFL